MQQLSRYFLVALASTLLDIATGWAILARLDGELAALWAASGGLIAGLILGFLLSRAFVFAKPTALLWVTLLRFCSVVLLVWLVRLRVIALVEFSLQARQSITAYPCTCQPGSMAQRALRVGVWSARWRSLFC